MQCLAAGKNLMTVGCAPSWILLHAELLQDDTLHLLQDAGTQMYINISCGYF